LISAVGRLLIWAVGRLLWLSQEVLLVARHLLLPARRVVLLPIQAFLMAPRRLFLPGHRHFRLEHGLFLAQDRLLLQAPVTALCGAAQVLGDLTRKNFGRAPVRRGGLGL